MQEITIRRKWRPPLALVIALVCALLVALPVIALMAVRLTSNQFVREIESSLLAQSAIYAEAYSAAYTNEMPVPSHGRFLSPQQRARLANRYHPVSSRLSVFSDPILPPRPDGQLAPRPSPIPYSIIASDLDGLSKNAQKTTLAGYMALDAFGRAFSASGQSGYSYAHIPEVKRALNGETVSVLRYRSDEPDRHPLNSISRDTNYRVFVAAPVVVEDRIVGAVYLSRTPSDLRKFLYQERRTLTWIAVTMVCGALLVGFLLWRLISGPIRALMRQSHRVAEGDKSLPDPLNHYGVSELADLGQSVILMAQTLAHRSEAIKTYTAHVTHELKSPVTTIVGASELLKTASEGLTPDRREKLYSSIHDEGLRMNLLLERLRDLARAQIQTTGDHTSLSEIVGQLRPNYSTLKVEIVANHDAILPLTLEQGIMIMTHMAQNAQQHGATKLTLSYDSANRQLAIRDNGRGISATNMSRLTDPFFTTRRDEGGSGMGLAIVKEILDQANATMNILPCDDGAHFVIEFRAAVI